MKLDLTRAAAPRAVPGELDPETGLPRELAGARYYPREHPDDRDMYLPVSVCALDEILGDVDEDTRYRHVMGTTFEFIEAELTGRHPACCPGARRILFMRDYEHRSAVPADKYNRRGRRWDTKEVNGWVILAGDYLGTFDGGQEQLRRLSEAYGALMLPIEVAESLFLGCNLPYKAAANSAGFTWSERACGLVQVRYAPESLKAADYRRELREWQQAMKPEIPADIRYALYKRLSPDCWTHAHPFHDEARTTQMFERRGWGHERPYIFDLRRIRRIVEFNLRVWRTRWWRSDSSPYSSVRSALTDALPYAPALRAELRRRATVVDPPDNTDDMRWFYRWMLREARAMKIPVPRATAKPVPPR